MKQVELKLKNIIDPPEKVRKMYHAVMGFIQDDRDMSTIKVSDITSKAGIGKGTAYEYFSSKEELLTNAMMWGIASKIQELSAFVQEKESFQEKCFCIFDWLETYKQYSDMMMKIVKGNFDGGCCRPEDQMTGEFGKTIQKYIYRKMTELLAQGLSEGVFFQEDPEKQALAFLGAVFEYSFIVLRSEKPMFLKMNQEQLKQFVYDSMVRALS